MGTNRWYPTTEQLKDPVALERTLRQMLSQHYSLVDKVGAMNDKPEETKPSGPPPGSGPSDSMICGLRVAPVDTQTLADGARLTFVKSQGHFQFK
jgi:hypothetical protein